ncbi:DUF1501 domain-containing protein [Prosthecomicrobium sp. N25]|uniref:DUF1501 domain-containing protein n=1 Tax=Prosthecomicrobium sp. N25 TaxID=3129254 RepID=UPI003076B925
MAQDHDDIDPRIAAAAAAGCEESRLALSRRAVLGLSASFFSWAMVPGFAEAGSATDPRLLIVVLRGGMDGLNTVVPFGDPDYVTLRGGLAIPAASTIAIDGFFGLNAAMPKFGAMVQAGEAAVVHAACVPLRNRSHFDCQDNLENGQPGQVSTAPSGWLNRLLTALPAGSPVRVNGALQVGPAPLILAGPAPVLGWSPAAFGRPDQVFDNNLVNLYRTADPVLYDNLSRGLAANAMATAAGTSTTGTLTSLQKSFRGAAALMAQPTGPRIAVLSVTGFDTHINQASALAAVLGQLDTALDDFRTVSGAAWSQTVVACVTEFGRTAKTNGTYGTDHGVGTVALLAGGSVQGGKVYGDWPGLAAANLYEGRDLRPTTDLRAVFKGLLADHLGVGRTTLDTAVFPGSGAIAPMTGLVRAATAPAPALAADSVAENPRSARGIAKFRRLNAAMM